MSTQEIISLTLTVIICSWWGVLIIIGGLQGRK